MCFLLPTPGDEWEWGPGGATTGQEGTDQSRPLGGDLWQSYGHSHGTWAALPWRGKVRQLNYLQNSF